MNIALLAKLNWRMYHEKKALWAKVLLKKYCSIARCNSRNPDGCLLPLVGMPLRLVFQFSPKEFGGGLGMVLERMFGWIIRLEGP